MNVTMNATLKKILSSLSVFFSKKKNRRILYLVLLGLIAMGEFFYSGLVRRTFVFYSYMKENTVVEDRMLHWSRNRETDIRRYIEDALLGPVSPDLAPLFPRETRLNSFMYRDAVVFADLTESAALPLSDSDPETGGSGMGANDSSREANDSGPGGNQAAPPAGGTVFRSLLTLDEGIRRNFPYVKDVRLFIGGNEVFFEEFRGIFANPADNSKTSP